MRSASRSPISFVGAVQRVPLNVVLPQRELVRLRHGRSIERDIDLFRDGRGLRCVPLSAEKVLSRIRDTRGGEKLYDARFGTRGRGEGPYATAIATMFDATVLRLGLDRRDESQYDDRVTFQRPPKRGAQLSLF